MVIVSHSLALIVDSDCIYAIKKDHLVESGIYDELYEAVEKII